MFYISTRGHSASGWLAKQISQHPRVVCWHGTRSIPPQNPGLNDLSSNTFVDGLKIFERQRDQRVYGAIHGFHGVIIKNEIEKEGGKFAGLYRDPIAKISSFFHAYLWSRLSEGILAEDHRGPTEELLKKISNTEATEHFQKLKNSLTNERTIVNKIFLIIKNKIKKKIKRNNKKINIKDLEKNILLENNTEIITNLFFEICKATFFNDHEIFANCKKNQLIIMEQMVSNKDYYINNVWNYLIPEYKNDVSLKNFEQKAKPHNPNINLNTQQKFEKFPKSFQNLLTWFFDKQKTDLINFYKDNNYLITK